MLDIHIVVDCSKSQTLDLGICQWSHSTTVLAKRSAAVFYTHHTTQVLCTPADHWQTPYTMSVFKVTVTNYYHAGRMLL